MIALPKDLTMNMNTKIRFHSLMLAAVAVAALAGCNTVPPANATLDQARSEYRAAQATPATRDLASGELKQAGDALNLADAAWSRGDKPAEVDHLAYLAKQRVAVAQAVGTRKSAEAAVASAETARDKQRLAARTNEADAAQRDAQSAQRQAEASQRQSDAATQQAALAQQKANEAQSRNSQLEAQLKDLNAKKTDRGLVITIGDVLFDTNQAQLKTGGMRSVEKLGVFLRQYPQRKAMVEGFTDSVGSDSSNQALSARRADAVRLALVNMGVGGDRVATHGYGESYPMADNESASGRQLNRRVEIVLSDDSGNIVPR
jgi:outer membrane protein OmpA-like peptidoglycan-associated protein